MNGTDIHKQIVEKVEEFVRKNPQGAEPTHLFLSAYIYARFREYLLRNFQYTVDTKTGLPDAFMGMKVFEVLTNDQLIIVTD